MMEPFLPQSTGDTVWTFIGFPLPFLPTYLAAVNIWAFALMGFDKRRAKKKGVRRIRERTLFLSALLGGGLGACLGMWTFLHKTKHWYFAIGMPLILAAQIVLYFFLI